MVVTTFTRLSEFEKDKRCLDVLSLPYTVISPDPGYMRVGVPTVAMAGVTGILVLLMVWR